MGLFTPTALYQRIQSIRRAEQRCLRSASCLYASARQVRALTTLIFTDHSVCPSKDLRLFPLRHVPRSERHTLRLYRKYIIQPLQVPRVLFWNNLILKDASTLCIPLKRYQKVILNGQKFTDEFSCEKFFYFFALYSCFLLHDVIL